MRRGTAKRIAAGSVLVGGVVILRPGTHASHTARRQLDSIRGRLLHVAGRARGLEYRLRGLRPDPDVADAVVADRIRSSLGPLEKRLDVPRVHVMVENHLALLHGTVGAPEEADEIERAVEAVSGVVGVESYLHVGLSGGDTRPSTGKSEHPPSEAHARLVQAAVAAGLDAAGAERAVRATLATFAGRLPAGEREQVAGHLPEDVRDMFTPPRRAHRAPRPRTVKELAARVSSATPDLTRDDAERVMTSILHTLRTLVADEAHDVASVLPTELRQLWQHGASDDTAGHDEDGHLVHR